MVIDDNGSSADATYTVTATTVQINNQAPITYSGYDSLTVKGSSGTDTFSVQGLAPAIPVTIDPGAGTSAVNVGAPGNTLDPLAGSLTVNGAGVTNVTFNNQGANPQIGHGDYWYANQADFYGAQHLHVNFTSVGNMTLNDPGATTSTSSWPRRLSLA
jgi:hypothetical protein